MLNLGYIKLHREIQDNWLWFAEPFTKAQAWIDLIMIARHHDKAHSLFVRGNKIDIKRGQIARSQESLASRWKWSRKKVVNFLNLLEKEHQIAQQKSKTISIITIINYDSFQGKEQQKSNRRATEEQQKHTNKNDKNDNKNDKNPLKKKTKKKTKKTPPQIHRLSFFNSKILSGFSIGETKQKYH